MRLVTDDAARLTQGEPALGDTQPELAASAGMLTVTVGLGRSLFERLGLAREIPAQLPVMPDFSTDRFERPWSETDLMLQVGADDPVTLSHTVRMLARSSASTDSICVDDWIAAVSPSAASLAARAPRNRPSRLRLNASSSAAVRARSWAVRRAVAPRSAPRRYRSSSDRSSG